MNKLLILLLLVATTASAQVQPPVKLGIAKLVAIDVLPYTGVEFQHIVLSDGTHCVRTIEKAGTTAERSSTDCKVK